MNESSGSAFVKDEAASMGYPALSRHASGDEDTDVAAASPATKLLALVRHSPLRFQLELEFVELLANPMYLQHLAQNRYFDDPGFLVYLSYLRYWHQPAYVKYISHPHCLYFLDLLQKPEFREKLLNQAYVESVYTNQYWHWRFFRWHRFREKQGDVDE